MRETRLDSWKEIAEYLARDVTTVIRWEKQKGLPVHRVPGGKRSVIFAYTKEIDEWLAGAIGPSENGNVTTDKSGRSVVGRPKSGIRKRLLGFIGAFSIALLSLAGIAVRLLHPRTSHLQHTPVQLTFDSGMTTDPAISKDGAIIAYASDRGGGGYLHIWVLERSTGRSKQLTEGAFDDHEPTISPDGQKVVFRSERDGGGLYSVPVLGGSPVLVVRKGRRPRFSPDGSWIAYWTGTPGTGDPAAPGAGAISIVAADGGISHPLSAEFVPSAAPVWSPESKSLLFRGAAGSHYPAVVWWITPITGKAPWRVPLDDKTMQCLPEAWIENQDMVLCSALSEGHTNIWRIPIRSGGIPQSAMERLTSGEQDVSPSYARSGDLVFASLHQKFSLRAIPLDSERAIVTGADYALTVGDGFYPSVTVDGNQITFVRGSRVWHKDLAIGRERELVRGVEAGWQRGSPDGSFVAFTSAGGLLGFHEGTHNVLCGECNRPWDVSPDHRWLTTISRDFPRSVRLVDLNRPPTSQGSEGSSIALLERPGWNLYLAHFSHDGLWIAFAAKSGPDRSRVYVAPFREGRAIPESDWIPVTEGASFDGDPVWSPGGNWLYFLSDRDGVRCVWAQALARDSKRPVGTARAIYHSHSTRQSLAAVPIGQLELALSRNKLVMTVGEVTGNIWLLK